MQIKTVQKIKLPYQYRIKGINRILNRLADRLENNIIRKSPLVSCVKGYFQTESQDKQSIIDSDKSIVLSMTTYPAREQKVIWTIKSLLRQNTAVDKFVVWLDQDEYKQLPNRLSAFEKYGVEFRFCSSLRSHKKYFYAMQEFSESIVITADDDVIYPEDTLEKLIKMHKKFPDCVICNQGRWVKTDEKGFAPYKQWTKKLSKNIKMPSFRLLPIGEGAVLYPPKCLCNEVFDKDKIINTAITADDLWLKFMAVKNGTRAMVSQSLQRGLCPVTTCDNENSSLNSINVAGGQNDLVIRQLNKIYPEVLTAIQENDN